MVIHQKINGKRIYLNSLDSAHVSKEYAQWMKDKDVLRFLDNPDGDYSLSSLCSFVQGLNDSLKDYLFGIFLQETGKHIGNIRIGNIHPKHHRADVGIIIGDKSLWGQGYATEAISLCVDFAAKQLKLHKLYAGMIEGNEGSYKPFIKAGFKESGCLKDHFVVDGTFRKGHIVEIILKHG